MGKRQDPRRRYSATGKFEWPEGSAPLFTGLMPRAVAPRPGYVLHMVREGDRLDRLANDYYGDPRLWWAIAEANPGLLTPADLIFQDALVAGESLLRIGTELRIPPKPGAVMTLPQIFTAVEPAGLKLMLGQVPVEAVDLYPVLMSVTATVSRKEAGVAVIELSLMRDETGAWPVLDGGWFTRWNPVRIVADFGTYAEDVLWGYVLKTTPEFPADRGAAKVTVEIQDETIALDRQAVAKEWNAPSSDTKMTDGQIVATIATDHRLSVAGDGGQGITVSPLTQDKTDFRFVAERAEKIGYEFLIEFGEVYFGPINLSGTPQEPLLVYAGPDTSVREFSIDEEGGLPSEATMSVVDTAGSGEPTEARVQPNLPILGREAAYEEGQAGLQPFTWAIKQEGDAAPDAAEMLAQAKVNEASLSIVAEALVDSTQYGHVIQPGKLITVDGVGERYGGRFYVDSVEHVFDAEGYTQKAVLLKNGVNEG